MFVPDRALTQLILPTSDGGFRAAYANQGLAGLCFPAGPAPAFRELPAGIPEIILCWHRLTTAAVCAVLAGESPGELPPLDLSRGTKFQQSVWAALRRIPLGQTQSYGDVAAAIGHPNAVRAVGGACGANPIPLLIPCHRVLAAHNKIGGFSGGLPWKRKLLARENIRVI